MLQDYGEDFLTEWWMATDRERGGFGWGWRDRWKDRRSALRGVRTDKKADRVNFRGEKSLGVRERAIAPAWDFAIAFCDVGHLNYCNRKSTI
ncbi:MAG: hypothetical protein D6680_20040 [Cyanobacteria bacterium J007]|nr:MAG: hypothetical protein D6680_20040 [Cyanobacteria bacterium J007]